MPPEAPPPNAPLAPPRVAPETAPPLASGARPSIAVGEAADAPRLDTRHLEIAPRPVPEQRISLSARRLAWVSDTEVSVYSLPDVVRVVRKPLPSADAGMAPKVIPLIGGSFFALVSDSVLRISQGASEFRRFPRASLLGMSWVFPDRSDVTRWWALSWRGGTLLRYDVADSSSSQLLPTAEVELQSFDGRAFGALRDGAVVYSSPAGLVRRFVGGRTRSWANAAQAAGVWRVLPGRTEAEAWVVFADGRVQRRSLARWGSPLAEVSLNGTPYSVDASPRGLAVVVVRRGPDDQKQWFVELWSQQGLRTFAAPLPAEAPGGGDWVARATADRDVAVSARWPLVAVGGAHRLTVFETTSGAVRYDSAHAQGAAPGD